MYSSKSFDKHIDSSNHLNQYIEQLRKKNKELPDSKQYYEAIIIRTVWYLHKHKHKDQCKRIHSPEINPCMYGLLIYDKGSKYIQWGKDSQFTKWYWENWISTCKGTKLDHYFIPYTKITSKLIKNLNVKFEIIKLLEENTASKLLDIKEVISWQ